MKASTYVIGDIHGRIDALREVLTRSRYNNDRDCLIVLGDVCDRAPGVRETIDLLLIRILFLSRATMIFPR